MPTPEEKLAKRFWRFADKQTDGCWLWSGSKNEKGYGSFGIGSKSFRAHRIAYTLAVGPIPEGLCVMHRCDVSACVNPAHLFIGTIADNNADMRRKGRASYLRGERHSQAKLTRNDVLAIREATKAPIELARHYGVANTTIINIQKRKMWAWL